MEHLNPEAQADIKKMSSDRIRLVLAREGADLDELAKAERGTLLNMMADLVLNPSPKGEESTDVVGSDDRHLQLLERQIKLQEAELQFRREDAERRDKQAELECEWRRRQFELEREKQKSDAVRQESLAARIKFYGDALKLSTVKMTDEPGDLPHFFTSLENVFDMYEVPSDLRAKLTIPLLTNKAKTLLARLPVEKMSDFSELRAFLLSEFRLTSEQYRERFVNAKRKPDETFTLLSSRLRCLFVYYLTSRKVGKDFDKLVSLMVADRLKEEMPVACLKHILAIETTGDCLDCDKLAEAADIYMHSHLASGLPRMIAGHGSGRGVSESLPDTRPTIGASQFGDAVRFGRGRSIGKTCYQCGSRDHLVSFHKRNPGSASTMRGGQQHNTAGPSNARVNRCIVQSVNDTDIPARPILPSYRIAVDNNTDELMHQLQHCFADSDEHTVDSVVCVSAVADDCVVNDADDDKWLFTMDPDVTRDDHADSCVNTCNVTHEQNIPKTLPPIHLSKMHYRDVLIQETGNSHTGLEDSGAEICLIRSNLIKDFDIPCIGKLKIRGIVGNPVEVDLVQLSIKPAPVSSDAGTDCIERSYNIGPYIKVIFAVCDGMVEGQDIIFTADVLEQLNQLHDYNVQVVVARDDNTVNPSDIDTKCCPEQGDEMKDASTKPEQVSEVRGSADTETLSKEQVEDSTLQSWWKLAENKKGNFFVKNGLLLHREKFLGHTVEQLCLPVSRILPVLKLGHDAYFSGHYAYKTTLKRVRLSFYFPNMAQKIKDYCASCHDCQMRTRELVKDRTPITPIPRNETPFAHLWWDCIGPLLDPAECKGRPNYCLMICDSATRYVFGFPLKRITAEAVSECLIQVFMLVGVASVVSGDCGSNFRAELTRECLKRLGCSPRFNTPLHPSASGQIERMNQTFKHCLHHVIRQHPKTWHKFVPYVLWAMREAINSTTGLSPYHLALGRPARGPLAILKENWTGEDDLPLDLGKSTVAFLQELKANLQAASDYANEHCKQTQRRYAHNYNLRSTDRKYDVGQQVIVLLPDGQSRHILSRWQGPATVVERKSPYSYVVELNGQKRHLHADRLRAYNARVSYLMVQHCAIVDECDVAFGELSVMPKMVSSQSSGDLLLPSERIDPLALSHLTDSQRTQLLTLLDEFPDVFSDTPGLCPLVMHEIRVTDDFKPKCFQAYRLPEPLKVEVARQIKELLDLGFIKPSRSPMVSPVVCVLKKNEGDLKTPAVRLTVDYRYLNRYTVGEMVPMPAIEEMIHRVGRGNFITTADIRSSYWQIAIKPEDTWLTAFITDFGVFEWVRAPFGLKWSGNSLVRAMQITLSPLREFADSYVDDMSVFSDVWLQHLTHIRSFLLSVKSSGLTLNLKKCRFALPEVTFLGHVIGSGKHGPDPEKVQAIECLQTPKTKSDLRKVLGFFSYFRMYLSDFALVARPLTDLTGKSKPNVLEWSQEHQTAINKLKSMLSNIVRLNVVQYGEPFGLSVDASRVAVGSCIFQWAEDGSEKPIAFASLKLTTTQQAWATVEMEAFAVIWSLQKFRNLTFGAHIIVYSDHNPLTFVTEGLTKSAKLMRWALALQEYNIEFRYRPGSKNVVADCLSRLCDNS